MSLLTKIINKYESYKNERKYVFPKIEGKSIYIFSIPTFGNIGDLAIAEAEEQYIKDNFSNYNLILIPDYATNKAIKIIKNKMTSDDLIMIHGGGT